MKILFIHQNFPGQFQHLAPALASQGHEVLALTMTPAATGGRASWNGVRMVPYMPSRQSTPGIHPWLVDTETKLVRGEAAFRACLELQRQGFHPDVVIAHPGWGESLFVKEVWPDARLAIYCEFFYQAHGADVGFDPEFPDGPFPRARMRAKNFNNLLHVDLADAGISPTRWQADGFPSPMRDRIAVIHDGIDTDLLVPNPAVALAFSTPSEKVTIRKTDEVITFVSRDLEPLRGYHRFMRALPEILQRRPHARVLVVGGDGVSYGPKPDPARYGGRSWKQIFLDEVRDTLGPQGMARVHFLGRLSHADFVSVLQISSVHVYLTYPYVLSWSLLEAMSVGCAIVASDTAPVREAVVHDETGRLVDFFDPGQLAQEVCALLDDAGARARLGGNARLFAQGNFDLRKVCLPRQLHWLHGIAGSPLRS
ncbi:glycosyltransferase [Acidovorax sp. LjRoot118]|uniref:glycosyltransferase n=1 Tax=Acidovorax sp. LjRoot118 TaxID=3342256 RepID=UPI003ED069D3